jgi:hypothetical protein
VPVEFAKYEGRIGVILSILVFTLIPAFFELIYTTTCHVKPLIVIFAITSYLSLVVVAWHKMRFLRENPREAGLVCMLSCVFIYEVVLFWLLISLLSLTLHSATYGFEIIWTAAGFTTMIGVALKFKFSG